MAVRLLYDHEWEELMQQVHAIRHELSSLHQILKSMSNELNDLETILGNMKTDLSRISLELASKVGGIPDGAMSADDVAKLKADMQATADQIKSIADANAGTTAVS